VALARAHRAEISGVSLNEEAVRLVQYQQAYQAVGKLIQVLDGLSETLLEMIR
jgi:flagellar hook-associated protein 1 FlgK